MRSFLTALLCFKMLFLIAQEEVRIALIHDEKEAIGILKEFQQNVQTEIRQLLQHKKNISFHDFYGNYDPEIIQQNINEAYRSNDVIITLGFLSSQIISQRKNFPVPTIASIVSDSKINELPKTSTGTSGVDNLTYIESPFDIQRDLETLHKVRSFENLAVVYDTDQDNNESIKQWINSGNQKQTFTSTFYNIRELLAGTKDFEEDIDAVFVLPIFSEDQDQDLKLLFDLINSKNLPSTSLFGETYIEFGSLIAYENSKNLSLIPRRIALNTMKIVEGQNAKDISVEIRTYNDNLLINMETARKIGIYPSFGLMAKASIIGLTTAKEERHLSLQSAIAEALRSNLDIQLSGVDVQLANTDIGIAQADQLPQLDVSTNLSVVDDVTALSYRGAQGQVNWVASANVSQVILSEPLLANIAIQKLLKKGKEYELQQTQMDIIVEVAEAYLNILQAEANLSIQSKNVEVTKENYNISKSKNELGYTGAADLYRWEAELASKNIALNDAYAVVQQAKFRLNQLLNRPINERFSLAEESLDDQMLLITDERSLLIDNYGQLEQFTSYLVEFAKTKLPTLNILDNNIKAQERLKLSRERAFYLPSIALSGSANRVLGKYEIPDAFEATDNVTTWNLGIGLKYPVFQGNLRKRQLEQTELQLRQLDFNKKNIQNQLELRIRSNMETIYVSYSRVTLAQEAADAAAKNFEIVQDGYNQGQINITTLIDAQNNTLQTELNANNAVYTFILDFISLERSIGFFYFLASEEERAAFFQNAYLSNK